MDVLLGADGMPGHAQRFLVDIGGVDLDPLPELVHPEHLGQHDGQTVRLFTGRAARAPHPQRLLGAAFGEEGRNDLGL